MCLRMNSSNLYRLDAGEDVNKLNARLETGLSLENPRSQIKDEVIDDISCENDGSDCSDIDMEIVYFESLVDELSHSADGGIEEQRVAWLANALHEQSRPLPDTFFYSSNQLDPSFEEPTMLLAGKVTYYDCLPSGPDLREETTKNGAEIPVDDVMCLVETLSSYLNGYGNL